MKEIGGYLGLEESASEEYYKEIVSLNTARNALVYLIKAKSIKKIYIPFFLCESIKCVLERENCNYEQYHINKRLLPSLDKKMEKDEYLYFVNYYGMFDNDEIAKIKDKYENIIIDNVQAFFQAPIKGIDTIYSCRKFFGVPDGAYLSTDACVNEQIEIDVSMNRMKHILGRYEGESANEYYSDFKANDASFKDLELRYMSRLTHNLLRNIDYESAKAIREQNYKYLNEKLGDKNLLKMKMPAGPYAYPFYAKNGMQIKKQLAEKKIYVPTLWPNVLAMDGSLEKDYAENILPLPTDQRHGIEDMARIVEEITLIEKEKDSKWKA